MKTLVDLDSLPELPNNIKTFWGQTFTPKEDIWKFDDIGLKFKIDFREYKNSYLQYCLKLFLSSLAYSKSLSHIVNCYTNLKNLKDFDPIQFETELIAFIDTRIEALRNTHLEYSIWYFKAFYLWCSDIDLPFYNEDYADFLERMLISGNVKGQAVLSLNSNEGPLEEFELNSLIKLLASDQKTSKGKVLAYLFLTLGSNPRNLSLIKWSDFSVIENDGHTFYFLKVPRIKKRIKIRGEFKVRELDSRVGELLENYGSLKDSEYIFSTFKGTPSDSALIRRTLVVYLENLTKNSPISNIEISPRRLRYTFATNLVASGVSKERLADLLDHSDLQHVQIYYDLRHKIKSFLTNAETTELGKIFGRFEGVLHEESTNFKKDLKYYSTNQSAPVGSCGSNSFCDLNAPYSCFTCSKFNAFEDSVNWYEEILKDLQNWKSDRKEQFDENDRIQFQMDSVISALQDLISRIRGQKA